MQMMTMGEIIETQGRDIGDRWRTGEVHLWHKYISYMQQSSRIIFLLNYLYFLFTYAVFNDI